MSQDAPPRDADDHDQHASNTCGWCPVCMLVAAAGEVRPEVGEHLRTAGRELALALRAVLDDLQEPPESGRRPGGLRRIPVDGD